MRRTPIQDRSGRVHGRETGLGIDRRTGVVGRASDDERSDRDQALTAAGTGLVPDSGHE